MHTTASPVVTVGSSQPNTVFSGSAAGNPHAGAETPRCTGSVHIRAGAAAATVMSGVRRRLRSHLPTYGSAELTFFGRSEICVWTLLYLPNKVSGFVRLPRKFPRRLSWVVVSYNLAESMPPKKADAAPSLGALRFGRVRYACGCLRGGARKPSTSQLVPQEHAEDGDRRPSKRRQVFTVQRHVQNEPGGGRKFPLLYHRAERGPLRCT